MISFDDSIHYDHSLCQQCGACEFICPKHALLSTELPNGLKHIEVNTDLCISCRKCISVCPSHRKKTEGFEGFENKAYVLAHNTDETIQRLSSSGGACRTLIIESLKQQYVDGVYSLLKSDKYPYAKGTFFTKDNIPLYEDLSNSIYHSIRICDNLPDIRNVERLMIVGTSCQLYALENTLKGKYKELVKICIFCKQQKTLDSTRFLAKVVGQNIYSKKNSVKYRGDGWPGVVKINTGKWNYNKASILPFGRRLWTVPGCNICGDPFGETVEADITLMDPWHVNDKSSMGDTLIVVHTTKGGELISNCSNLERREISFEESLSSLGFSDIKRKRLLIDWWKGLRTTATIKEAGEQEKMQREFLEKLLIAIPRMPKLFYSILNKIIPRKRDTILNDEFLKNNL